MSLREEVEKILGTYVHDCLFCGCLAMARKKQERIIAREGDADGVRQGQDYLAQLVAEAVKQEALTALCLQKNEEKKNAQHDAERSQDHPQYSMGCDVSQ